MVCQRKHTEASYGPPIVATSDGSEFVLAGSIPYLKLCYVSATRRSLARDCTRPRAVFHAYGLLCGLIHFTIHKLLQQRRLPSKRVADDDAFEGEVSGVASRLGYGRRHRVVNAIQYLTFGFVSPSKREHSKLEVREEGTSRRERRAEYTVRAIAQSAAPMAGVKRGRDEDPFQCGLCRDVLMNPVSACGAHAYCKACLELYISGSAGRYCPACCKPVSKELRVDTSLAETINLRESASRLQAALSHGFNPALAAEASADAATASDVALFHAGLAKRFGLGTAIDLSAAIGMFRAASTAPRAHAGASAQLAFMLLNGVGVPRDRLAALHLLQQACGAGAPSDDPVAQHAAAPSPAPATAPAPAATDAAAAAVGSDDAILEVSAASGAEDTPAAAASTVPIGARPNPGAAADLFAIAQCTLLEAEATAAANPSSPLAAMQHIGVAAQLRELAAAGDVLAMTTLAKQCVLGRGGGDRAAGAAEAVRLLRAASKRGDIHAVGQLGLLLAVGGTGVPPNPGRAAQLLRQVSASASASVSASVRAYG
jgi:TPR repeat protein